MEEPTVLIPTSPKYTTCNVLTPNTNNTSILNGVVGGASFPADDAHKAAKSSNQHVQGGQGIPSTSTNLVSSTWTTNPPRVGEKQVSL